MAKPRTTYSNTQIEVAAVFIGRLRKVKTVHKIKYSIRVGYKTWAVTYNNISKKLDKQVGRGKIRYVTTKLWSLLLLFSQLGRRPGIYNRWQVNVTKFSLKSSRLGLRWMLLYCVTPSHYSWVHCVIPVLLSAAWINANHHQKNLITIRDEISNRTLQKTTLSR